MPANFPAAGATGPCGEPVGPPGVTAVRAQGAPPSTSTSRRVAPAPGGERIRGQVVERQRDVHVVHGTSLARVGAHLVLVGAWLPALAGPLACLAAASCMLTGALPAMLLFIRQRPSDPRPKDRGEEIVLRTDAASRCTVKVPRHVVGPLAQGDEVEIAVRQRGADLYLTEGINLSQGGRPFRPPVDPWPRALWIMALWTGLLLAAFPR